MTMDKKSAEKFKWTHVQRQFYATIAVNLLALSQGTMLGWFSPALPILTSPNTPLSSPLTNSQISSLGSINSIGALIGAFFVGSVTALLGSKRATLILAIPSVIYWLMIYFAESYYQILAARFIMGCSGSITTVIYLYVSKISNDEIHGRLGSFTLFFRNIGTLVGFVLGATVTYEYIPIICVTIPIVFVISFMKFPNTPHYYINKGQIQKAEASLKYFKGFTGKGGKEEEEAIHRKFERLKFITEEEKTEKLVKFADVYNWRAAKEIGIGIALIIFTNFTASSIMVTYAVYIFQKVGSTFDPHVSSIILVIALICGSFVSASLADVLGRRILCIVSLMGAAIGLIATALYHYLAINKYDLSEFQLVPVVSLSFTIFIASAGIFPLSTICSIEYLPSKIRTIGMMIVNFSNGIISFGCLKMFPILTEMISLYGTLSIFVVVCIVGVIFVYFVLRETTGEPSGGSFGGSLGGSLSDAGGLTSNMKTGEMYASLQSIF